MNYEAVLAGLPDSVIAVDAEGRVVFWNAAAEQLTGRSLRRASHPWCPQSRSRPQR